MCAPKPGLGFSNACSLATVDLENGKLAIGVPLQFCHARSGLVRDLSEMSHKTVRMVTQHHCTCPPQASAVQHIQSKVLRQTHAGFSDSKLLQLLLFLNHGMIKNPAHLVVSPLYCCTERKVRQCDSLPLLSVILGG